MTSIRSAPSLARRSAPRPALDARTRALHHAARLLCAVPPRLQRALAGGPVVVDGLTLEPELMLLRGVAEKRVLGTDTSIARFRAEQERSAMIVGGPGAPLATRDLVVDGAAGPLRARHYVTAEPDAPLLVFFHGGGFVFGGVDTHDAPCRLLARHAGVHVLSVEYRLAPEHPFPAPVDDALAAFRWAHAHAADLGADPARVAVGGDSAGANLAAVTSLFAARGHADAAPYAQLLVYPPVDRHTPWASLERFADGFYLTREAIDWFHLQYVTADRVDDTAGDPRLNPMRADDLADVPPALVVTAGFDPLRDEGEAYAAALEKAGNDVTLRRFGSLVHGFFNMVGVSPACRDAVVEIAGATRMLLARTP